MELHNDKVKRIIKEVAVENTLTPETVNDLHLKFWRSIRHFMNLPEMPRIIVRNFGTFDPYLGSIEKYIKRIEEGEQTEEKTLELERLKKVRERLNGEAKSRRHSEGEGDEL